MDYDKWMDQDVWRIWWMDRYRNKNKAHILSLMMVSKGCVLIDALVFPDELHGQQTVLLSLLSSQAV